MNITHVNKSYLINLKGFTLIESIVVLALISIAISSTVPYLTQAIDTRRNMAQVGQLQASLSLARQYAVANIVGVVICPARSDLRQRCRDMQQANTNWQFGWLVFADQNRDGQLNDDEIILRNQALLNKQAVVFNQNGRLRYFADGRARSAGFYLCNASASSMRHLLILHTGRTRISSELSEINTARCRATINS